MIRRFDLAPVAAAVAAVVMLSACAATPEATRTSTTPDAGTPSSSPTRMATERPTGPSQAATPAATQAPSPTAAPTDALLGLELIDVRTGDSFTLADVAASDGPVLLEPMAIWCSNCRAQQHQVLEAHGAGDFTSVSLDVDLTEAAADLADYAEREGFSWRFAMADADLYRLLQSRFGDAATNPPSTPLIVIERDGTVRPLEFGAGVRSAEQLLAELGG